MECTAQISTKRQKIIQPNLKVKRYAAAVRQVKTAAAHEKGHTLQHCQSERAEQQEFAKTLTLSNSLDWKSHKVKKIKELSTHKKGEGEEKERKSENIAIS